MAAESASNVRPLHRTTTPPAPAPSGIQYRSTAALTLVLAASPGAFTSPLLPEWEAFARADRHAGVSDGRGECDVGGVAEARQSMSCRRVAHRYCVAMSDTTIDTPSGSGTDRLQIIAAVLYFGGLRRLAR